MFSLSKSYMQSPKFAKPYIFVNDLTFSIYKLLRQTQPFVPFSNSVAVSCKRGFTL